MRKKIVPIILILCGLFSAFLGTKVVSGAPANQEIIENAVYVTDGKADPENEGKVVIATGTLSAPLPFVDEETGVIIDTIVAHRYVEEAKVELGGKDEEDTWTWLSTISKDKLGGSGKIIAPGVTIGEFKVADELMMPVPTLKQRDQYTADELSEGGWDTFRDKGAIYLYQKDYMPCEDDVVHYDSFMKDHLTSKQKNEGTLRIRYNVMEEDASLDYTIIGLQKNGKLEKVEELDIIAAMEGHLTPEEILAQSESISKGATVFYFAIAAVLVGLGIWKFIKAGKSAEEQKSKKRV